MSMRRQSGFALILVVLALLALFATLSVTLLSVSLGGNARALAVQRGSTTTSLAEGCMEEVLGRVRADVEYTGGAIDLEGTACTAEVNSGSEQSSATATVSVDGHVRTVTTTFVREASVIRVLSWLSE